jgi:RND family efflux transporter MFP subunit
MVYPIQNVKKSVLKKIVTHLLFLTGGFKMVAGMSAYAQDYTELDCLVKPEMYINISSPVDGVIDTVLVNKSDIVKKGQVLAKLESSVEAARVLVAQQEAQMENLIASKQIRYEFTERKRERLSNLLNKKVLSKQEYDESVTDGELAKTELVQARLDKKANEMRLLMAKAVLEQKIIKSPIDGIVVERYLMPGETTENHPIMQLAKIDPLLVEVVAPSTLFGKITKDMAVEVRPDAPANNSYQATVSVIDKIIDAASGTFSIRLALPNPDAELIGGTKCIARFAITEAPKQISKSTIKSGDDDLPEDIKALLKP